MVVSFGEEVEAGPCSPALRVLKPPISLFFCTLEGPLFDNYLTQTRHPGLMYYFTPRCVRVRGARAGMAFDLRAGVVRGRWGRVLAAGAGALRAEGEAAQAEPEGPAQAFRSPSSGGG